MEIAQGGSSSRLKSLKGVKNPDGRDGREAAIAGAVFFGFLVLCTVVSRLLHQDELAFFPKLADDAYYYYDVAAGWWDGEGLSTDGLHLTNGVQPLWMLIVLGLTRLSGPGGLTLLTVQLAQEALVVITAVILYRIVSRASGRAAGIVTLGVLIFPRYLNVGLIGLEGAVTSLALVVGLHLLANGANGANGTNGGVLQRPAQARDAGAGLALGLLMLGRLDSVFILVALCTAVLWLHGVRGEGTPAQRATAAIVKSLALFWPTLPLVLPYLAYNLVVFDHLVPISGAVKSSFPHASMDGWGSWSHFAEYWLLLVVAGAGAWVASREPRTRPLALALACMTVGASVHWLHTLAFMHWGVYPWHFATYIPLGVIGAGLLAAAAFEYLGAPLRRAAIAALLVTMLGLSAFSIQKGANPWRVASREAAQWTKTLPAGSRFAMRDSGLFGFFSPHPVTNLDGIISNFEYQEVLCHGDLRDYLKDLGIDYVVHQAAPANPGYGVYEMKVGCRFESRRMQRLQLDERDEAYRTKSYVNSGGRVQALVAWRLR